VNPERSKKSLLLCSFFSCKRSKRGGKPSAIAAFIWSEQSSQLLAKVFHQANFWLLLAVVILALYLS